MKITNKTQNIMELKESNFFSYVIALILAVCSFAVLFTNEIEFKSILGFLVLLGIAVIIVISSKKIHIVIDKSKKVINRYEKTLLKESKDEIKIDEINHVDVREIESYTQDSEGYSQKNYSFNILLVLKNKQEIRLNYNSSSSRILFFKPKSKDQKTGKEIADFLGVSYKESKARR